MGARSWQRRARRALLRLLVPFLVSLGLAQKAWVGASTATAAAGRLSRGRILAARSWGVGPLGPVESAAAFRIYYLPFVEPLDIDGNLLDQLFGGWFGPVAPLLLGVLVFWIQGQINAVRREQEGKVLSSAAKAVGSAASGAASSAASSLSERLLSLPKEQWLKLLICLAIDLAGDATFLLPGLGELGDVAYAPLEAVALRFLFGGAGLSVLGFFEEALPFTDALPTATTGWVLQTLFSDSPVANLLGVQPLQKAENEKKP
ncbi:unnamed protein product [Symbiodinium necroappetens]|uniref:Uncharacterized protein n=1 Tax=Symbiodinium necroappetens TaxID=1628268 RepID=A0A813BHM0_9DINO|nr:unnamed protein product [Symbiodinium necroappetens]